MIKSGVERDEDDILAKMKNEDHIIAENPNQYVDFKISRQKQKMTQIINNAYEYMDNRGYKIEKETKEKPQYVVAVKRVIQFLTPHGKDMEFIVSRYDQAIQSFFEILKFLVIFSLLFALIYLTLLIMQMFRYGNLSEICNSYFFCFMLYSRFSSKEAFTFSISAIIFVSLGLVLILYKWIKSDYAAKESTMLGVSDRKFSTIFFNMWDFRNSKKSSCQLNYNAIENNITLLL